MGDGRWLALGAVAAVAVAGAVASSRRGSSDKGKKRLFEVGGTCDFGPGRLNESCQLRVWVPEDVTDEDAVRDDAYAKFYEWIDEQGGSEPWGLYCAEIMRVSFRNPRRQGSQAKAVAGDHYTWRAKGKVKLIAYQGQEMLDFDQKFETTTRDSEVVKATALELIESRGYDRRTDFMLNHSEQELDEDSVEIELLEYPARRSFRDPQGQGEG